MQMSLHCCESLTETSKLKEDQPQQHGHEGASLPLPSAGPDCNSLANSSAQFKDLDSNMHSRQPGNEEVPRKHLTAALTCVQYCATAQGEACFTVSAAVAMAESTVPDACT
ncbi:hypothetical protein WJX73_004140 [Symbiochloris irregularis]|uniref:Uncharacterized protein n=1 Tax=Symbiochloris irregularis TaxID=706552 RepID=A0AAW1NHX7_9CHLO